MFFRFTALMQRVRRFCASAAILDRDGATLDPAEFAQSRHKGVSPWTPARSIRAQEPDGRPLVRLLRARRERPRNGRAAQECDEVAPPHATKPTKGQRSASQQNCLSD